MNPQFVSGDFTVVPCLDCPFGSYQPNDNTTEETCQFCGQLNGLNTSTLSEGSDQQSLCKGIVLVYKMVSQKCV